MMPQFFQILLMEACSIDESIKLQMEGVSWIKSGRIFDDVQDFNSRIRNCELELECNCIPVWMRGIDIFHFYFINLLITFKYIYSQPKTSNGSSANRCLSYSNYLWSAHKSSYFRTFPSAILLFIGHLWSLSHSFYRTWWKSGWILSWNPSITKTKVRLFPLSHGLDPVGIEFFGFGCFQQ